MTLLDVYDLLQLTNFCYTYYLIFGLYILVCYALVKYWAYGVWSFKIPL